MRRSARDPDRPASRYRRYLLLEMPAWVLVGVSVAYALFGGSGGFGAFFQFSLLLSAVAWLLAGRIESFAWASLMFGWALGTMGLFNLLAWDFGGNAIGLTLVPVTLYLGVMVFFLEDSASLRNRLTAAGGVLASAVVQLSVLAVLAHP